MKPKIIFIANNNIGSGLSGGDRIFLELARYWQPKTNLTIIGSAETKKLLKKYQLPKISFHQTDTPSHHQIFLHQLIRTLRAFTFVIKNPNLFRQHQYIYTVSDFVPDLIFGIFAKIINPRIHWIAACYLIVPPPWQNKTYHPLYYFSQRITLPLINLLANTVYLTSQPDLQHFPTKKCIVIQGGVNPVKNTTQLKTKYQAIFIGRLHPQKGILELIDIWRLVVNHLPSAKLAIIGNGPLLSTLKNKIKKLKLSNHIFLFGFLDGPAKNKIIRQSQIVLHPAIFDSGGMASAEAMIFGLPGVSFDLPALKTYYPQGIIKTPCFNQQLFAQNIIKLLTNPRLYHQTSLAAQKLILHHWLWPHRAKLIFQQTFLHSQNL